MIALGLFLLFSFFNNRCHQIVTFSIGSVDPKFKVTSADIQKVAVDAADRWNKQTGENLLKYDAKSSLKINLIYDSRQADVDQFNTASQNLQQNRQTIESSKEKFDNLLVSYQGDLSKYNQDVSYWNAHGGATPDVFSKLEQTRLSLGQRRDQLISMSKVLNIQGDSYNSNLNNLQDSLNSRKNLIITQGLYVPSSDTIDIYTFGNIEELRLVLMHELGHALGLTHAQNEDSLMYYLLGSQDLSNPTLTSEDKSMLSLRCSVKQANFYRNIFQTTGKGIN